MDSKSKMLIVDDKRVNRYTLKDIFENEFDIVECANGNEAIDYLNNEGKPTIVLLDIIMPESDGFDVLDFMRQGEMRDVPVILITASADESQMKKGYTYAVADYIHKPFDEAVVQQRVRHVLEVNSKRH